ncbi:MAG TPA: hypothetical protein VK548_23280 [Candidatus Acidoferrum sp.]|nr:hypothetical protein [Candidatus Acidoferrum sp.]
MSQSSDGRETQDGRVRLSAEFACLLVGGALLGIWHAQLGTKAVFTFRNDEPYSSWIGILFGPLSTLPAVALALVSRRWSAAWLVAGGLVSLGVLVVTEVGKGNPAGEAAEFLLHFLFMVAGPMIALGLGLVWVHRRLARLGPPTISAARTRHTKFLALVLGGYFLLSLGALFVADFRFFKTAIDTTWGLWVISLLLGPLMMLAMGRFIGMPIYLAESVVVLGLLWLAITAAKRRRAALLGALAAWVVSGLFFLAIVFGWS